MPYAPRAKRVFKKRRAPARKPRSRYAKAPARKRGIATGKPVGRALYSPAQPSRQIGYLPFAPRMQVRLPYVETLTIAAPGSGVAGTYVFRLNSLYDPNLTQTGHQPMQYDQLTGIYRSYIVRGCKVDLEFSDPSGDGLFVGYNVTSTDTYSAAGDATNKTLDAICEMRNSTVKPIVNTGSQTKKFSQYFPIAKLMQKPSLIYNADRALYAAAYSASPTKEANLSLIVLDSRLGTASVLVRVRLTYFAEMYDQIPQSQS